MTGLPADDEQSTSVLHISTDDDTMLGLPPERSWVEITGEQYVVEPKRDRSRDVELVLTLSAQTLALDEQRPDLAAKRESFEHVWALLLLHAHAGYGELDARALRRASELLLADKLAAGVPVRCPDCGIVWYTDSPFDWALVGAEPTKCFECMFVIEGKVLEAAAAAPAIDPPVKTSNGRRRTAAQREADK